MIFLAQQISRIRAQVQMAIVPIDKVIIRNKKSYTHGLTHFNNIIKFRFLRQLATLSSYNELRATEAKKRQQR